MRIAVIGAGGAGMTAAYYLDNGVIEFHLAHSPNIIALMAELDVPLEVFKGGSSSLYRENGLHEGAITSGLNVSQSVR